MDAYDSLPQDANESDAGQGPAHGTDQAHELQQLEPERATDADAAPMAVQALDQGSGSDAGRGPAEGPHGAGGAASTALGPADGPVRAAAPAAADADAAAQAEEVRMAQEADRVPAAEDVSRGVPAAVASTALAPSEFT